MTDEDRQIERLLVHKKIIGWLIAELKKQGIEAKITTNNSPKGDILIVNKEDAFRVKKILRNLQAKFNNQ
jgi:hypothetical protein